MAHVKSAGVLSDTRRDRQCELFMKKGGNTRFRPFQSLTEKDFFVFKQPNIVCNAQEGSIKWFDLL